MVRIKLTQRKLMDIYNRVNKKPKTILSEDKLLAISDRVNGPTIKFKRGTVYPFKIKQILPAQKTVNITKNGQVMKTINVRRKSKYFTGNILIWNISLLNLTI